MAGDRISISPEEIAFHAANLQVGNDAIKNLNDILRSRMSSFDPGGGGPDADAIQAQYLEYTTAVLDATDQATQAVKALTDTMTGVGNKLGEAEDLRAADIKKLTDGLDDYPVNYDVKNSGPAGPPHIGTTGPVVG